MVCRPENGPLLRVLDGSGSHRSSGRGGSHQRSNRRRGRGWDLRRRMPQLLGVGARPAVGRAAASRLGCGDGDLGKPCLGGMQEPCLPRM